MSQQAVAEKLGITRRTYIKYEHGEIKPPFEKLLDLHSLFDVSIDYLMGTDAVQLTDDEWELLAAYRKLPDDKKDNALRVLDALE